MSASYDEHGMRVARRWAGWYLGSPRWAEEIIGVYLNPAAAEANLAVEMGDDDHQATHASTGKDSDA